MNKRLFALLASVSLLTGALPVARALAQTTPPATGIKAGYGVADATWHVGAGAGQYAAKSPDSVQGLVDQGEIDPHNHSTTQENSYGIESRLSFRALVVEDAQGDQVALVKSDNYLAMDALARRVGQILAENGSKISYDEIFHMATHNHFSPMYSTPSWGVWLFQDVMDIRAFEYQARQMASAILQAESNLVPARMGATEVKHYLYKGMVARRQAADDGSPVGYPLDFGDFGLPVIRFDNIEDPNNPKPIATLINWGMHPEGLAEPNRLITAEFLGPLERYVERATGAPLVFGQGDVGSSESGPARPYSPDWPDNRCQGSTECEEDYIHRQWDDAGHAQVDRGAFLLSQDVIRAWNEIGAGSATVPFDDDFDVAAGNAWVPGPLSHPYPSVSNCRSHSTVEGNPGAPVAGLPDCARGLPSNDRTLPIWENLAAHGLPVPEHYDAPAFTGVEENMRLHLQAFKLGEVILMSCACEAQVDLIKNLESRTNTSQGDMWLGYKWWERLDCQQNADTTWTCSRKPNDTPDEGSHPTSPNSTFGNPLTFTDAAMKRMKAEVLKDAAGWNDPEYVPFANSEPADPEKIKGNFTHTELSPTEGYLLPIGVGHAGDYNGYTVSYREYMSYDHYRKALTSYGPHTADYMSTILMALAKQIKDPAAGHTYELEGQDAARESADETRQQNFTDAMGATSARIYDEWYAALPDDAGEAEAIEDRQPKDIKRFDSTSFSWRGGSNAIDNPTVIVERCTTDCDDPASSEWQKFADQSGEIQTRVAFPEGINGFAQTYAGNQEWIWTANFEAFDAFPAQIGSTPEGTYRFAVVNGFMRKDGEDVAYASQEKPLYSKAFDVSAWNGLKVQDLRRDESAVSFTVDSDYPLLDEGSAFPEYVRVHMRNEADRGEVSPGDIKTWCDTCSFRPWATKGVVQSADVTIVHADGSQSQVDATQGPDGRWHAAPVEALSPDDRLFVARGGVVDNYGEINGACASENGGTECPPEVEQSPTPTETPTEDPGPESTSASFTDRSVGAGQYSDQALIEASLVDSDGDGIEGAELAFEMVGSDGSESWTVTTDADGVADKTIDLTRAPGNYNITVRYAGSDDYLASADLTSFLIEKEDSVIDLVINGKGSKRTLVAGLTDSDSPASGVTDVGVVFFADGVEIGQTTTNGNGIARLDVPAKYQGGHHDFRARFAGNDYYMPSSANAST